MAKGGNFEREICKMLSVWWTQNPDRDDVFWRSSNSGGRATIRGRKKKTTVGHYGDVAATDPIGAPLLDLATIELKRGYSDSDFHALFDRPRTAAQQKWEEWIQQAATACEVSGSYSWMIISRRDRREPIIVMESVLWDLIEDFAKRIPCPLFRVVCRIRYKYLIKKEKIKVRIKGKKKIRNSNSFDYTTKTHELIGMRFEDFLKAFDRTSILRSAKGV